MKLREDFTVPFSKEEVVARADALLAAYGYKREAATGALLYIRGTPNSIFYHINPRRYRSEIELWPVLKAGGTEVSVTYKLTRLGSPILPSTKDLLLGEFSDLLRYLIDDQDPQLDREAQATQVGVIQTTVVLTSVILACACLILGAFTSDSIAGHSMVAISIIILVAALVLPIKASPPPLEKPILPEGNLA
jgi:hypothetical protein